MVISPVGEWGCQTSRDPWLGSTFTYNDQGIEKPIDEIFMADLQTLAWLYPCIMLWSIAGNAVRIAE